MFDKLVGNESVKKILRHLLSVRRVPNALLLAGADGVGKKQFAFELAKSFVCQNPQNGEACDRCAACLRADKFNFPKSDDRDEFKKVIFSEHPDIGQVIPFGKNILVDAIRHLETEANFRPYQASNRFFIIDEADKMNESASNALLKTLEEPPATAYIFLVSARPDALLPTIRSRCQTLRFAPVDAGEIEKFLTRTKQIAPADARILAKLSSGEVGRALQLDVEKFKERRKTMLAVLEGILIKPNRGELLRIAEEIADAKNKDFYEDNLEILQTLIHDVWILSNNADAKILINVDLADNLNKFAANTDSRRLANWLAEIETTRGNLAFNINKKIATDALLMQMANN